MNLFTTFHNEHELLFLQHKTDAVKVEHEAHTVATLNEGNVTDMKCDDHSVSPTFPSVKCETEVSLVFIHFE
jgi:hypothetical protein